MCLLRAKRLEHYRSIYTPLRANEPLILATLTFPPCQSSCQGYHSALRAISVCNLPFLISNIITNYQLQGPLCLCAISIEGRITMEHESQGFVWRG